MSGPVTWETLIWVVGIVAGGFSAGALTVWRVVAWVNAEFRKRDLAIEAEMVRAAAVEKTLEKEITDHKLYAAERFATEEGVGKAFEAVQKSIDRMSDRLDQVIAGMTGQRSRSRTNGGQ